MTDFNASDRDVNRAIRSWLHADRHEDASRIAGAVLDRVEATPRRRATWWPARRSPTMNKFATVGLGAAAVVVLALLLGTQLLGSPGGTGARDDPTPTPEVEPTLEPTPSPSAAAGLPEGPFLLVDANPATGLPALTVTIPAPGWEGSDDGPTEGGGILLKNWDESSDGAGMIVFELPEYVVYGDPCHWKSAPNTSVTTVDEFVAALSAQSLREGSEPVDISLDGYAGKSITLHTPDDVDFSECDDGTFASWSCDPAVDDAPCGFHGGPGETTADYILDVNGVLMAWHTGYEAETPADVVAELEAIVQSASFGE
jgi:hypothetical protein